MSSTLSIFKHTEVVEKTLPFRRMQSQGHRLEGKMPGLCGEWEVELKCPQGVRTGGLRPRWHGAGVPACCVKTSRPLQEEGAHPGAVSSTDRGEKTPPTASGCCLRCGAQFLTRCAVRSLELRNASRKQPRIRPWWGQRGNTTPPHRDWGTLQGPNISQSWAQGGHPHHDGENWTGWGYSNAREMRGGSFPERQGRAWEGR